VCCSGTGLAVIGKGMDGWIGNVFEKKRWGCGLGIVCLGDGFGGQRRGGEGEGEGEGEAEFLHGYSRCASLGN